MARTHGKDRDGRKRSKPKPVRFYKRRSRMLPGADRARSEQKHKEEFTIGGGNPTEDPFPDGGLGEPDLSKR